MDTDINGKQFPFTFWITDEDLYRIKMIVKKCGVDSESSVIIAAIRHLYDDLNGRWKE